MQSTVGSVQPGWTSGRGEGWVLSERVLFSLQTANLLWSNQMQIIRGCGSCTAANPNQTRQKTVIFLWDPQHRSQLCGCQQWGKASSGAGTH